jgi:hypothetical protein
MKDSPLCATAYPSAFFAAHRAFAAAASFFFVAALIGFRTRVMAAGTTGAASFAAGAFPVFSNAQHFYG